MNIRGSVRNRKPSVTRGVTVAVRVAGGGSAHNAEALKTSEIPCRFPGSPLKAPVGKRKSAPHTPSERERVEGSRKPFDYVSTLRRDFAQG